MQEIRQYGVTVVSYTWAMLRDVVDDPAFALHGNHPVRLFIGSGMPTGLWQRVIEVFAPAHVVEFFATTDGQAVLANVSGAKIGSKGRPLPGGGRVELAAYDADHDLILEDDRGFVQVADTDQVGVLLARPRGPIDPTASVKRGVFAPADTWISTEYLFRRDADGDFWLVGTARCGDPDRARCRLRRTDHRRARPDRRSRPRRDLRGDAGRRRPGRGDRDDAAAGCHVTAADLTEAVAAMPVGLPPDVVHVVAELPLSATYRPVVGALRNAGIPRAGRQAWYFDRDNGQFKRLTSEARADLGGRG